MAHRGKIDTDLASGATGWSQCCPFDCQECITAGDKGVEALNLLQWVFDTLLGAGLLWLAWRALASPNLYKAIVLFIAFGLLMTLAWVRLEAPDVALAEAAIGTGLTGALLLSARANLRTFDVNRGGGKRRESIEQSKQKTKGKISLWLPAVPLLLIAVGLGYAVSHLAGYAAGLTVEISENIDASGVSNPVTAVLLNFRAYDTLLEIAVLLLALLGVWSLGVRPSVSGATPDPVLDILTRFLTPLLLLVAAYLLWVGAHAPGGAFQAGSVLGAVGVLLILAGWRPPPSLTGLPLRLTLVAGLSTFVIVAVLMILGGGRLLEFPPSQASLIIIILEATATLSIAATLAALFLGARPDHSEKT
jgi:multisubunit Na+/H+ antiporter MnhB subunit